MSVRKVLLAMATFHLFSAVAAAQGLQSALPPLSLDQQNKISEIVTDRTPQPLVHINFALQRDALIPSDVTLQPLPSDAEKIAPEFRGYSYLAVEELVAIVDTNSRKVVSVMQRMRRQ